MKVVGRRTRAWSAMCACVALAALWLSGGWGGGAGGGGGGRATLKSRRGFPLRAPHAVAHLLADFSTLPHARRATPGSWRVKEERGNFTVWRYRVAWACGATCAGEANYEHVAPPPDPRDPRTPVDTPHRLALRMRVCRAPAPASCDEMEIRAEVLPDGADGAVLREEARASCGAGRDATEDRGEGQEEEPGEGGDEACERALRVNRAQHHANVARGLITTK